MPAIIVFDRFPVYDLEDLIYPLMHRIADNLDDVHEYLYLTRQACATLHAFENAIPGGLTMITRSAFDPMATFRASEGNMWSSTRLGKKYGEFKINKAKQRAQKWVVGKVKSKLEEARGIVAEESLKRKREEENNTGWEEDPEQKWKKCKLNFILDTYRNI